MTYLACIAVGFLGGFTFGFRVAAMIRLGVQRVAPAAPVDQVSPRSPAEAESNRAKSLTECAWPYCVCIGLNCNARLRRQMEEAKS